MSRYHFIAHMDREREMVRRRDRLLTVVQNSSMGARLRPLEDLETAVCDDSIIVLFADREPVSGSTYSSARTVADRYGIRLVIIGRSHFDDETYPDFESFLAYEVETRRCPAYEHALNHANVCTICGYAKPQTASTPAVDPRADGGRADQADPSGVGAPTYRHGDDGVAHLDALPDLSVILDRDGDTWVKVWGGWFVAAHSADYLAQYAPVTALRDGAT